MAKHFELPYFHKDDYLESLFIERGVGDADWRHTLSREADSLFIDDSISKSEVTLVYHWRPKELMSSLELQLSAQQTPLIRLLSFIVIVRLGWQQRGLKKRKRAIKHGFRFVVIYVVTV